MRISLGKRLTLRFVWRQPARSSRSASTRKAPTIASSQVLTIRCPTSGTVAAHVCDSVVVPFMSQTQTSPFVRCRHRMSAFRSPVKSPAPMPARPKSIPLVVAPAVTLTPGPVVTVQLPPRHGRSWYSSSKYGKLFDVHTQYVPVGRPPFYFNVLLESLGTLRATPLNLALLVQALPTGAAWGAAGIGRYQLSVNSLAITMGGHVRVGLEENLYLDEARTQLATNQDLVDRLMGLGRAAGRTTATPAQAREIVGLRR